MKKSELNALAREIADSAARSHIESYGVQVSANGDWYDLSQVKPDDPAKAHVDESVVYLQGRWLLTSHPVHFMWVRVEERR